VAVIYIVVSIGFEKKFVSYETGGSLLALVELYGLLGFYNTLNPIFKLF
jgi:hypothetical protein